MPKYTQYALVGMALLLNACDFSGAGSFTAETGPITDAEIAALTDGMEAEVGAEVANCIVEDAKVRAAALGAPEQLNPQEVDLLPVEQWVALDADYQRIILTQVVINQAIPGCTINRTRD